jgi:O-antigen ligase
MAVWMLISCLLADDVGKAFMGDWRGEGYLTYIAYFAIYFCAYIAADEKSFAKVFELFSFVSYYAGIIGLLVEFDVIYVSSNNEIHASIFANGNHYGYYLAIALIAAAYHFLASARSRKVLHGIGLFIISFSFFLSQCRGAWLAGTISLIAFSVFMLIRRDRKPLAALTPIFIALAALVLTRFVYPGFADRMGSIVRDVNLIIKSDPSRIYTGTGRWLLWITGLKLIPAHPIFGYGLDNLSAPILSYAIDYTDRVHNEYLNYIVTIGIVGALAYFVFVFKIMITYLKKVITIDFFSFAIFCTAACYLASAFFGNTTPYVTPYLFMFLGFLSRGTGKWKAE